MSDELELTNYRLTNNEQACLESVTAMKHCTKSSSSLKSEPAPPWIQQGAGSEVQDQW